jgi:hypothetical protein
MRTNSLVDNVTALKTPILFIVFNRLDTTKVVLDAIRAAKPEKLYIAADGARKNKEGELQQVQLVRDYVLANINWPCEVKTLFREENLGCKYAVSTAISWFFKNEDKGIILEDDCLPSKSFFSFCEELLIKYDSDLRIWHIGGTNFQNGQLRGDDDYYYSNYSPVWGWASWASRWNHYDSEVADYTESKTKEILESIFVSKKEQKKWNKIFKLSYLGKIDTWDYQWIYTIFTNNGISIIPNVNLISNIGFGINATHTVDLDSKFSNLETKELTFPLKHPKHVFVSKQADDYLERLNKISLMTYCKHMVELITKKIKRS